MSMQSRIDETGFEIGQEVFAARTVTAVQVNPLQSDMFVESNPYVFGEVLGFMVFSRQVLVIVKVVGEVQSYPYTLDVWRVVQPRLALPAIR